MLTRILVDNFRALVNFEFRPGQLCLLLGDNGSGKSSLLEAIACVTDIIALGTPVSKLLGNSQTRWESRDIQRFELDIEGNGGTYRYILEIKQSQNGSVQPLIHKEEVRFESEILYRYENGEAHLSKDGTRLAADFPFQANQSFLFNIEPNRNTRLGWFRGYFDRVRYVQPNPFDMQNTSKGDTRHIGRYCQLLPSFLDHLNNERPDARALLVERLRQIIPGFRNFVLRRAGEEKLLIFQFSGDNDSTYEYSLINLSEGQRVLIALYAVLFGLLSDTALVCFDEPDNFVSLPEVQPWLQSLRDQLSEHNSQAIVISHHPESINYLALDSAWRFERLSGPVIARPLMNDIPPGQRPSEIIVRGG